MHLVVCNEDPSVKKIIIIVWLFANVSKVKAEGQGASCCFYFSTLGLKLNAQKANTLLYATVY